MCCSDPPPPPPDMSGYTGAAMDSAEQWGQMAEEQMNWARQQGEANRELLGRVTDMTVGAGESMQEFGGRQQDRFENVFQPREDQYLSEIDAYDSEARKERYRSGAMADVAAGHEAARRNALRRLEGFGVDPSTARSGALDLNVRLSQAAEQARTAKESDRALEETGLALRRDALQRGDITAQRGLQAQGMGSEMGVAGQQLTNQTSQTENIMRQGAIPMGQLEQSGIGMGADIENQAYQNVLGQYDRETERNAGMLQGIGNIAAVAAAPYTGGASLAAVKKADGGEVESGIPFMEDGGVETGMGDGSGIDDTVPAYLSDGEYVIPADVVRKKGEEFFDKIVQKYHTPAAEQRRSA